MVAPTVEVIPYGDSPTTCLYGTSHGAEEAVLSTIFLKGRIAGLSFCGYLGNFLRHLKRNALFFARMIMFLNCGVKQNGNPSDRSRIGKQG